MKKFSLILFLTTFSLLGQNSAKTCEILSKINALVQQEHFRPKPLDDSLSVYVFDTFIDGLDGNRNLFTKAEYENLCKHRLLLDNYVLKSELFLHERFCFGLPIGAGKKEAHIGKNSKRSLAITTARIPSGFRKRIFLLTWLATDFERVWRKRVRLDILEDIQNWVPIWIPSRPISRNWKSGQSQSVRDLFV